MAYNPLFDLAIGLFLIFVPVLILCALVYIVFFQQPQASDRDRNIEDWEGWVGKVITQAQCWKKRLASQEDHPSTQFEKPNVSISNLDDLISKLESLRHEEVDRSNETKEEFAENP